MNDNVIQLTPELVDDMRKRKLLAEEEEQIDLEPISPGEIPVGTLTDEERPIYIEYAILDAEVEDWGKEIQARSFESAAKITRASDTPEQMLQQLQNQSVFKDKDEAEQFFYELARRDYLRNLLFFSLRSRLNEFGSRLGVRSGWMVVRVGLKYTLSP